MNNQPVINFYNSLYSEKTEEWPVEDIIRFGKRYILESNRQIVDLGCGTGRHCFYFGFLNHKVWGLDISKTGIKKAQTINKAYNLPIEFRVGDMKHLPYTANFFDYGLCWNAIFYQDRAGIKACLKEIQRCLKKHAYFVFSLKHPADSRYKIGKLISHNTYIDPQGLTMHYSEEKETLSLITGLFKPVGLESVIRKNYNTSQTIANWIITVQKI